MGKKILVWLVAILASHIAGTSIGYMVGSLSFVEDDASDEKKNAEITAKVIITLCLSTLVGKFIGAGAKAMTEDK